MSMNKGDEFEDDLGPVEDTEDNFEDLEVQADEDWDSYDEDPQADDGLDEEIGALEPPAQKKSGLIKMIVIGVGIIAVGGFVATHLGKSAPKAPSSMPAQESVAAVPAEIAPDQNHTSASQAQIPTPPDQGAGMLSSPQEMAKLQDAAKQAAQQQTPQQQVSDQPAAQIPTAPDANQSLAVPSAPALKEIPDAAVPPMPTAISSNEPAPPAIPASENKLQDRSGPARVPSAQDVMLKTPSAPTVVADEAKSAVAAAATADLSGLNDKMDKILNRLGSLESEMTALKSSKPDNGAQIDVLKDSVASLEKKITSLSEERQKNRSSSQQNSVPVAQPAMRMTDPAPAPDAKPAPQILGAPDADIPPVTSPRMTKRAPVAKASKTASVQWVLKGAQPDHAIVARAGENDMKTVAVGDSLPGIGQIQAISYQNGRWVVVGTQGRINQ